MPDGAGRGSVTGGLPHSPLCAGASTGGGGPAVRQFSPPRRSRSRSLSRAPEGKGPHLRLVAVRLQVRQLSAARQVGRNVQPAAVVRRVLFDVFRENSGGRTGRRWREWMRDVGGSRRRGSAAAQPAPPAALRSRIGAAAAAAVPECPPQPLTPCSLLMVTEKLAVPRYRPPPTPSFRSLTLFFPNSQLLQVGVGPGVGGGKVRARAPCRAGSGRPHRRRRQHGGRACSGPASDPPDHQTGPRVSGIHVEASACRDCRVAGRVDAGELCRHVAAGAGKGRGRGAAESGAVAAHASPRSQAAPPWQPLPPTPRRAPAAGVRAALVHGEGAAHAVEVGPAQHPVVQELDHLFVSDVD